MRAVKNIANSTKNFMIWNDVNLRKIILAGKLKKSTAKTFLVDDVFLCQRDSKIYRAFNAIIRSSAKVSSVQL
jgi:hypothetical protein